jgi:hypothetical protein
MRCRYIKVIVSEAPASVLRFAVFGEVGSITSIDERLQDLLNGVTNTGCFSWRSFDDARENRPNYYAIAELPPDPRLDEFLPP